MTFFVFAIAGMVTYGIALMRLKRVRAERDQDTSMSLDVGTEFLAGRPLNPAIRASQRRLFEPSDDPVIENARRATLFSIGLCVLLGVCALFVSPRVDRVILDAAAITPLAAGIPLIGLLVTLYWLALLPEWIVGPTRNIRMVVAAAAGITAGILVVAGTPTFLY